MKTQEQMVLDYLRVYGSITSLEAFKDLGCTRLSAKIFNLRQKGYIIGSEDAVSKNRFGKNVHYSKYYLIE